MRLEELRLLVRGWPHRASGPLRRLLRAARTEVRGGQESITVSVQAPERRPAPRELGLADLPVQVEVEPAYQGFEAFAALLRGAGADQGTHDGESDEAGHPGGAVR